MRNSFIISVENKPESRQEHNHKLNLKNKENSFATTRNHKSEK